MPPATMPCCRFSILPVIITITNFSSALDARDVFYELEGWSEFNIGDRPGYKMMPMSAAQSPTADSAKMLSTVFRSNAERLMTEHICSGRLLRERFVQLASEQRDLCFLAGSG